MAASGYLLVLLVGETKFTCLFLILVIVGGVEVRVVCLVSMAMVLQYLITSYQNREACNNINLYWARRLDLLP